MLSPISPCRSINSSLIWTKLEIKQLIAEDFSLFDMYILLKSSLQNLLLPPLHIISLMTAQHALSTGSIESAKQDCFPACNQLYAAGFPYSTSFTSFASYLASGWSFVLQHLQLCCISGNFLIVSVRKVHSRSHKLNIFRQPEWPSFSPLCWHHFWQERSVSYEK